MKISKEKIIDASWKLLRDEGIEGFSMRKLAERLDAQAASLYYYFKNKQSIFQVLADQVAQEALITTNIDANWKEQINEFSFNLYNNLKLYPCSAQLLMQTLPLERNYLTLINCLLSIIDKVRISEQNKFTAAICVLNYVISFELDRYEQTKINKTMEKEGINAKELFRQAIESMEGMHTSVLQRIFQNQFLSQMGSDQMFQTGLNILILGIEQLSNE